jgi:hypothetical protein
MVADSQKRAAFLMRFSLMNAGVFDKSRSEYAVKKACQAAAVDHPDYVTLRQQLHSTFVTWGMMRALRGHTRCAPQR